MRLITFKENDPSYTNSFLLFEEGTKSRSYFVFDTLNGISPNKISLWFSFSANLHHHARRANYKFNANNLCSTNNLFLPFLRTTFYDPNSIKLYGPKLWNSIPVRIKSSINSFSFKCQLKEYFISC